MAHVTRQKRRTATESASPSKIPSYSPCEANTPREADETTDPDTFYVVCAVMSWSSLQISGPFIAAGVARMVDDSNPVGFLPVFKTWADAERFKADAGHGRAAHGEIMVMRRDM
jgi:hypothetical protein